MQSAIRVEHLSKRFWIRTGPRCEYQTLRDTLAAKLVNGLHRLRGRRPDTDYREFWALRDVSFEVPPGEVVGVVGRNGAGKSTLLKVLSRIVEPTAGRAEVRGRLGSLLEVGTGFHQELTGRENIYMNGSILGMSRREIRSKFDEIVEFSGVGDFLDTPVKRYSSGMYVRLAFAVAAHLEPEILIVDEVLAVGDAAFQDKCLGKMKDVARSGRTVFFVSHNLSAVQALCTRGLVLQDGQVGFDGPISEATAFYLSALEQNSRQDVASRTDRSGNGTTRLTAVDVSAGWPREGPLMTGGPARFVFRFNRRVPNLAILFTVFDRRGQAVATFDGRTGIPPGGRESGSGEFVCEVDELLLTPGRYRLNVILIASGEHADHLEAAAWFDVTEGCVRGRAVRGPYALVYFPHQWHETSVA